jgi:hypothetical protein
MHPLGVNSIKKSPFFRAQKKTSANSVALIIIK